MMGEEAPSDYDGGSRGKYRDDKGGNNEDNGSLYGRRCFECPRREDINKRELEVAETTD